MTVIESVCSSAVCCVYLSSTLLLNLCLSVLVVSDGDRCWMSIATLCQTS